MYTTVDYCMLLAFYILTLNCHNTKYNTKYFQNNNEKFDFLVFIFFYNINNLPKREKNVKIVLYFLIS